MDYKGNEGFCYSLKNVTRFEKTIPIGTTTEIQFMALHSSTVQAHQAHGNG